MYRPDVVLGLQEDAFYEVERQQELWGVQEHPDGTDPSYKELADKYRDECNAADAAGECTWLHILLEEIFEAAAETNVQKLLVELNQAQAVILSWQRSILTRD
jgi:hypothetical protein